MALWILRVCFLLVAVGLGLSLTQSPELLNPAQTGEADGTRVVVFILFLVGAIAVLIADVFIRNKRIDMISSVYFGLVVGLFLTYVVDLALTPFFGLDIAHRSVLRPSMLRLIVVSFAGISICYSCVSLLWQTREDFRFVIPYVEFSKDVKGGRRGLDVLDRLRNNKNIDFKVYDRELPEMQGQPVDIKLLLLARHLDGKVVTGDFNLNKVAKLQNVPVINLNEIANSLKPVFLPGELIKIRVVKQGEGAGQGVGYLDDGTMIVIEDGRDHIGEEVDITVTSMLQTSAGRMVFGKYERPN
jgi:uncharacterized protein YacL